jgi:ADP-ribose pyrophosphatase
MQDREAYDRLRAQRPDLFANPDGVPVEILLDADEQAEAAAASARQQRELGLPEAFGDVGVWYRDPYLTLVKDAVRFPSGRIGTYIRIFAADDSEAVVVLATTPDGRIVLVRHFRHGCREWHWEFPRGFGEAALSGIGNAAKELFEEIGRTGESITRLGAIDEQDAAGRIGVYHAVVDLGANAELTEGAAEEGITEVRPVTAAELTAMIRAGDVTDMYTLSAWAVAVASGVVPAP